MKKKSRKALFGISITIKDSKQTRAPVSSHLEGLIQLKRGLYKPKSIQRGTVKESLDLHILACVINFGYFSGCVLS
jgi:hypothetical protein